MKLPQHPNGGVQVGISDINAWRDCAARMQFGMRRHEGEPWPESWSPANAYGSAIHLCLFMLDNGATPDEAAGAAMTKFKRWLEPSDLALLRDDMRKYLEREMLGVRTLLNEGEISVRLFVHPVVGQVWFRAQIDRLYQDLNDAANLIHVDYKSSKHAKSEAEVDADTQIWSYNWSIVRWFEDFYPEVGRPQLVQWYDQLRYGQILTTKSDEQLDEIEDWLIVQVNEMIADEDMAPSFNQWCPWCPIKMDCPVVQYELTDWATTRIAALMPRGEKLNKDGSVSKRPGPVKLDPNRIKEYVELLPAVKRAHATLEAFDKELTDAMKAMPLTSLEGLGKARREVSLRKFSPEAKQAIIEEVGLPTFLLLCDLSIAGVERFFANNKDLEQRITALAEKTPGYEIIVDARG